MLCVAYAAWSHTHHMTHMLDECCVPRVCCVPSGVLGFRSTALWEEISGGGGTIDSCTEVDVVPYSAHTAASLCCHIQLHMYVCSRSVN